MKKLLQTLLFVLALSNALISNSQGQLTTGVQTSNLTSSIAHWVQSTSDINSKFYAVTYWVGGTDSGNYLKVYNATTFAPTSGQILVSTYHAFTRVRIDDDNNIYVLYTDRTSAGSTTYRTYIKKYNSSGTQIGSRIEVTNNTKPTDIEVAPNGDVLIGCAEGTNAKVKIFRNMIYKGFFPLGTINAISNTKPFSIQMDMKKEKLVVGYSHGSISNPQLNIKRYIYSPSFIPLPPYLNLSSLHSHYIENGNAIAFNNNRIAIRNNWETFFVVRQGVSSSTTYKTKKLSSGGVSIFENGNARVDVDINNKLILSKNYGSPSSENNKVKLFSNTDSLIYEYILDAKIKNSFNSLAIYDCEFLVTGIDRKFGGNPLSYSYESFHQLFNCQDCRPNMGATAVAKFRYPYATNSVPSKYGPLDVTELCLVDNLLVDGSLSSCETGYFVGLSEFNPMTWTNTLVLHSDWVYPLTQAPNNINIVDFLPSGYHLRPGKIYKFRLAVGSPWHSVDIFFEVSCCKRKPIIIDGELEEVEFEISMLNEITEDNNKEEINFSAYPNPVQNEVTLDFEKFNVDDSKIISIKNSQGREIYSKTITDQKETLNAAKWPIGLYIVTAIINDKTFQNKIIKE